MAVYNASYREHLYRIVAKHDSEWYFGKNDPLWQAYLETLNDIPDWKTYTEAYIEKMKWMKGVPGLASKVWHMHPVVFLDALKPVNSKCYCYKQGIVSSPCQSGTMDITKNDFEVLAEQLGIEREVLRAIALRKQVIRCHLDTILKARNMQQSFMKDIL